MVKVFICTHYNTNTYMGPFHDMPQGRLPQRVEPRALGGGALAIAMVLKRMLAYTDYTEFKTSHSFIQL